MRLSRSKKPPIPPAPTPGPAAEAPTTPGIGRKEIERLVGRIHHLNHQRRHRLLDGIQPWQRIVVELLPLLYHVNHPLLPGFVASDTPHGLADYQPDAACLRAARSLAKGFSWKRRALRRFPLSGLYLMGSIGSIGQSHDSDLDVWLCHRAGLDDGQRAQLREKAAAIEAWAESLGLEMHTFLIDPARFRDGQRDALSNESSGATQPLLLLEEFYRSAVWLAGRLPLWWLVAPEHEHEHARHASRLIEQRFIDPNEWLDLGGLEHIGAAEFFGAAQWQLYKGLKSPYKSVLKLLLIEAFASEFPRIDWLALEIKRAIWRGQSEAARLDPYLLMYRRIERHLATTPRDGRIDLIRRCLYIKADIRLSDAGARDDWRGKAWRALCDEWGWHEDEIRDLDARRAWKVDQVQRETRLLVAELTRGYRLLRRFAHRHHATELCETDEFNLLGKRLHTAFEQRPGKIERLNPRLSSDLSEPCVRVSRSAEHGWLLYRDHPDDPDRPPGSPLKAAPRVLELLAWGRANRVITTATRLELDDNAELDAREARAILDSLARMDFIDQDQADIEALKEAPRIQGCALLVNVGRDPLARLSERGLQLTSDRADPFCFGAAHRNLVRDIDCIRRNSWGELLVTHHEGDDGLLELLCEFLASRAPDVGAVSAWSHSNPRGDLIARRVRQLFTRVAGITAPRWRYVLRLGRRIVLLNGRRAIDAARPDASRYRWTAHDDLADLAGALGAPPGQACLTRFDPEFGDDSPLPHLFSQHRDEQLQLFYRARGQDFEYWLLDEQGALFHGRQRDSEEPHFVTHQRRFLDNLMLRRQLASNRARLDLAPTIHKLTRARAGGHWHSQRCDLMAENLCVDFVPLELLSANDENQHLQLLFDQRIFDSIVLGDAFYPTVARAVLAARRNAARYPIYLTGVANGPLGQLTDTIALMARKTHIERHLNDALRRL